MPTRSSNNRHKGGRKGWGTAGAEEEVHRQPIGVEGWHTLLVLQAAPWPLSCPWTPLEEAEGGWAAEEEGSHQILGAVVALAVEESRNNR